jgi:hypothetical protein
VREKGDPEAARLTLFPVAVLLVIAATAAFAIDHPDLSPGQAKVLVAVRNSALQYTQNLPNFMCTQITHREAINDVNFGEPFNGPVYSRGQAVTGASPASSGANDVIEEQLTFFDQMEHYDVVAVDNRKGNGQQHMQFAGAISAGEFGSALANLFDPRSQATFEPDKMATVGGRRAYVFKFHVASQNGIVVIHHETDQKILAAYSGRLFVDSERLQTVRITSELELPEDFPIRMATIEVDYRPVEIAGKTYDLPRHSELRIKDRARLYVNEIEFRNYRKFGTESTIHYDSDAPQPRQ